MSNSKKQTSVEWLVSKLPQRMLNYLKEEIEQAKAMHKEEMIEFSQEVFRNRYNQVYQSLGSIADDKYNETYGGDK